MDKDLKKNPSRISEADQRKSKVTVIALILIALMGVGIWSYLEFSADVMVDRKKGKKLAARFEKECQSSYTPSACRDIAGLNHATCFQGSIRRADDGTVYDPEAYMECMRAALEEPR